MASSTKRSEIADPRSRQVSLRLQDWSRSRRFGKGEKTEFLSTYENDVPKKVGKPKEVADLQEIRYNLETGTLQIAAVQWIFLKIMTRC